jgi:hypothetical protein
MNSMSKSETGKIIAFSLLANAQRKPAREAAPYIAFLTPSTFVLDLRKKKIPMMEKRAASEAIR